MDFFTLFGSLLSTLLLSLLMLLSANFIFNICTELTIIVLVLFTLLNCLKSDAEDCGQGDYKGGAFSLTDFGSKIRGSTTTPLLGRFAYYN